MFGLVEIDDGLEERIDLGPLRIDVLHAERVFDGLAHRGFCRVLVAAVGQALLPPRAVPLFAEANLPYKAVGSRDLCDATLLIA